jgi:ribosomal protein S13/ribosomal protein S11
MIYIFGVKIPNYSRLLNGLTRIYGLGLTSASNICFNLGFLEKMKVKHLNENDWNLIIDFIKRDKKRQILKDLKRIERKLLLDLINRKSYRSIRHNYGLPVRGQRTHSNAKTQRRLAKTRFNLNLGIRKFSNASVFNQIFKKLDLKNRFEFTELSTLIYKRLRFFKKRNKQLIFQKKSKISNVREKSKKKNKKKFKKNSLKKDKKKNKKVNFKKRLFFKEFKLNNKFLVINIFTRLNNILISLHDSRGNLKILSSGGSVGFTGRRKFSDYSAKLSADKIVKYISDNKLNFFIVIRLRGFGRARRIALKRLKKKGLKIKIIEDITPIAHNGCKSKKFRRV